MKLFASGKGWIYLWLNLLVILGVVLFVVTPVQAQSAPTTTTTCPVGGPPSSGARGDGNDIQCRIGTLLSKHQALTTNLQSRFASKCGTNSTVKHCDLIQDHLDRAQKASGRAGNANGRMKGSDFSDLNTVRKSKCTGKNSDCASGNGTISGGDTDAGIGSDIADHLDDAANGLDKANGILSDPPAPSASLRTLSPFPIPAGFDTLYDFNTDPDYPQWLHAGEDPKVIIPTVFALKSADLVAEAIEKAAEDACKQEAVVLGEGGNGSLACLALTLIEVALKSEAELLEFENDDTAAWDAHGAFMRAGNIYNNLNGVEGDLSNVKATVGGTQQAVNTIQTEVQALQQQLDQAKKDLQTQITNVQSDLDQRLVVSRTVQAQLLQLLLVPEGQRTIPASLLTCTGDTSTGRPCPTIVITCSPVTGQCSFNGK